MREHNKQLCFRLISLFDVTQLVVVYVCLNVIVDGRTANIPNEKNGNDVPDYIIDRINHN